MKGGECAQDAVLDWLVRLCSGQSGYGVGSLGIHWTCATTKMTQPSCSLNAVNTDRQTKVGYSVVYQCRAIHHRQHIEALPMKH